MSIWDVYKVQIGKREHKKNALCLIQAPTNLWSQPYVYTHHLYPNPHIERISYL